MFWAGGGTWDALTASPFSISAGDTPPPTNLVLLPTAPAGMSTIATVVGAGGTSSSSGESPAAGSTVAGSSAITPPLAASTFSSPRPIMKPSELITGDTSPALLITYTTAYTVWPSNGCLSHGWFTTPANVTLPALVKCIKSSCPGPDPNPNTYSNTPDSGSSPTKDVNAMLTKLWVSMSVPRSRPSNTSNMTGGVSS